MKTRIATTTAAALSLVLGELLITAAAHAATPFGAQAGGEPPTLTNDALQPAGDAAGQLALGIALLAAGLLVAVVTLAVHARRARPAHA